MITGSLLLGSFIIMCVFRAPIAVALLLSTMFAAIYEGIPLIILAQQFWNGLESFTLLAIPLFILSGSFMDAGGITERIAKLSDNLVGHIKGSLGHVAIICNMLLSGVSGSATADAAAVGSIFIPTMKKAGFSAELAAAINAASSTMGPIIPPSIIMVVYAASAGVSTGALFLAGVVPGVLVGLTQMLIVYLFAKKKNLGAAHGRSTFKAIWKALIICLPALLVPIIIIVGITFGIFTATEAAMIAAVYCLFIAMFIYRSIKISSLFRLFKESAMGSSPCLFCIGSAGVFGWMLAYLSMPDKLMKLMSPFVTGPISCLLILTGLFIIVGMFMDALPAIVIFQPIVTTMAKAVGLEPMHVAIVVVLVLCFGLMTPPYGITLLLSAQMAGTRSLSVAKLLLPFYVVFLIVVLITIFFPESTLWLPRWIMPTSFR